MSTQLTTEDLLEPFTPGNRHGFANWRIEGGKAVLDFWVGLSSVTGKMSEADDAAQALVSAITEMLGNNAILAGITVDYDMDDSGIDAAAEGAALDNGLLFVNFTLDPAQAAQQVPVLDELIRTWRQVKGWL